MSHTGPEAGQPVLPLRAILCHDDPGMRRVIAAHLERAGFAVAGETDRGADAIRLAVEVQPHVAIIHLALLGTLGLRLIPAIDAAAPGCLVIGISPLDTLIRAALDAGARAVVAENDLRGLATELEAIARCRLSPA
ncbi:MAG: response regulator [Actinomycetota bacterium]|nr:response regulator [Actinomycetota bacterium]